MTWIFTAYTRTVYNPVLKPRRGGVCWARDVAFLSQTFYVLSCVNSTFSIFHLEFLVLLPMCPIIIDSHLIMCEFVCCCQRQARSDENAPSTRTRTCRVHCSLGAEYISPSRQGPSRFRVLQILVLMAP